MKNAFSLYLNDVINPDSCDYQSYKKLGLTCPFCHEPVFLRKGYERSVLGITAPIPSVFCHFKDSLNGEVCELRSYSKEGKEAIQNLQIMARNQRLKLFNNHLWGIYKSSYQIRKQGKLLINEWLKNKSNIEEIKSIKIILKRDKKVITESIIITEKTNPDIYKYYQQTAINELTDFLLGNKGNNVLEKIVAHISMATLSSSLKLHKKALIVVRYLFAIDWLQAASNPIGTDCLSNSTKELIKNEEGLIF